MSDKERRKFSTSAGELRISREHSIFYSRSVLEEVFTTKVQPQVFYEQLQQEAKIKGIELTSNLLWSIGPDNIPIYSDTTNSYKYNSLGYRSPEFGSAKMLYAGCSTTFGTGVSEKAIWGSVVASRLGLSYANISKQGASASWIVKNVMAYFDEYGHPEAVFCLFPDLSRMTLASNELQLVSRKNDVETLELAAAGFGKVFDIHLAKVLPPKKTVAYSKKPHEAADVIPIDAAVYDSVQSILTLDQYCRSHGIKFLWSTWSAEATELFSNLKLRYPKNYKTFIDCEMSYWTPNPDKKVCGAVYVGPEKMFSKDNIPWPNCHGELLDKYGVNFYRGLDEIHGIDKTHPGVHEHAHIAEAFIAAFEDATL